MQSRKGKKIVKEIKKLSFFLVFFLKAFFIRTNKGRTLVKGRKKWERIIENEKGKIKKNI